MTKGIAGKTKECRSLFIFEAIEHFLKIIASLCLSRNLPVFYELSGFFNLPFRGLLPHLSLPMSANIPIAISENTFPHLRRLYQKKVAPSIIFNTTPLTRALFHRMSTAPGTNLFQGQAPIGSGE